MPEPSAELNAFIAQQTEFLKAQTPEVLKNMQAQGGLQSMIKAGASAVSGMISVVKAGASAVGQLTQSVQNASSEIGSLSMILDEAKNSTHNFDANTAGALSTFASFAFGINNGSAALDQFSKQVSSGNTNLQSFAKTMEASTGNVFAKKIFQIAGNIMHMSNSAQGFENSIMSAAMAGGSFAEVFGTMGDSSKSFGSNFDGVMINIAKQSERSANILGISFTEAHKRTAEMLTTLPGEYTKVYSVIDNLSGPGNNARSISGMEMLSQVARGTGKDFQEALTMAKSMQSTFGTTAKDAATRMAVLNTAAGNLKMPFESIKNLVSEMDVSFAMWGDQMQSTVKVLGQISSALKDSGVGYAGQIQLAKELGTAIKGLNISQKAFIGISSGMRSAGGMVGAGLQVEKMLQQGQMSDVVSMLQSTIEQKSGSKAISLNQAADSPELQRTFLVQRGLLNQSGISDVGTQNRLLEAMSKTQLGGGGNIDAEKELTNAMNQGNDMTQRQTELTALMAQNSTEMVGQLNAMVAFEQMRALGGTRAEFQRLAADTNSHNKENYGTRLAQTQGQLSVKGLGGIQGEAAINMVENIGGASSRLYEVGRNIASRALNYEASNNKENELKALREKAEGERTAKEKARLLELERGGETNYDAERNPFALEQNQRLNVSDGLRAERTNDSNNYGNTSRLNVPPQAQNISLQADPVDIRINISQNGGDAQQIVDQFTFAIGKVKQVMGGNKEIN